MYLNLITFIAAIALLPVTLSAQDNTKDQKAESKLDKVIEKWVEAFQPSTISKEEMRKELKWFAGAAKEFKGEKLSSVSEIIKVHEWEHEVVAKAFEEITGIKITHHLITEGQLVKDITEQMMTGRQLYDIYVNDSDLIGTHLRLKRVVNLTEYWNGEGKPYTNPNLDLADFLNLDFTQDYDGQQLQIPDQQFANLYWFRYDWFNREDIKKAFKEKYGYNLGVPMNWSAYEDIAAFFTSYPVDGKKVFGHMDYGKRGPALGWRFTDAWLSIAGLGDKGLPNGEPVDEWGVRVENRIPVGSTVSRGGELNGPAAVYALEKYITWMKKYAPPEAIKMEFLDSGVRPGKGDVAQMIFQYITWLSDDVYHKVGSPVVDKQGLPVWRVAPTPNGDYWEKGMKVGYQDAGSWTIPSNVRGNRRAMAWLWAQFCVSKSLNLKKFLVGGTPIRKSTIFSDYLTAHIKEYGGLIEFYRSPQEKLWTPTGRNIPHYPAMAAIWWPTISDAILGKYTPKEAMDKMAREQDELMGKLKMVAYSPKLNNPKPEKEWLSPNKSPKAPRPRAKPATIPYEELLKQWQ